jgi:hypothetical protein
MANEWLPTSLGWLYNGGLDALEQVIRDCPDDLWTASVWEVRRTDRHVWPIVRGMGGDLPDDARLQLNSAFCNVAFHVLFFLDHYLGGGLGQPQPPAPFEGEDQAGHTLPRRVYTRDELLAYLSSCRAKAESVLGNLTQERMEQPARIGRPFGDLLLNNLVQLTDHTAQLSIFLNREGGWSDPRWTPENQWYRRCPDCE